MVSNFNSSKHRTYPVTEERGRKVRTSDTGKVNIHYVKGIYSHDCLYLCFTVFIFYKILLSCTILLVLYDPLNRYYTNKSLWCLKVISDIYIYIWCMYHIKE